MRGGLAFFFKGFWYQQGNLFTREPLAALPEGPVSGSGYFPKKNRPHITPQKSPLSSGNRRVLLAENPPDDQFIVPFVGLEKNAANLHG
jgi:hypothetical protein